ISTCIIRFSIAFTIYSIPKFEHTFYIECLKLIYTSTYTFKKDVRRDFMIHIIGGGLQGMSIAFLLQKENIQSIVYDRNDKGQASAASAGIIVPWVSERRNKPWLKLVTGGAKYYPEFIKSLNAYTTLSTNYENNGAVILYDDDNKRAKAHKRIKDKMALYPESRELINDISKHDALTHDHTGLYVSRGSQVTGEELLKALKDAYINLGGIIKNKSFKDKDRNDV